MYTPKKSLTKTAIRGIAAIACLSCANAYAAKLKVTVESLTESDGLWFTPVFFGFHDGSAGADTFDAGGSASAELETIAETGDPSGLVANMSAVAGSLSHVLTGSFGPPGVLFAPGSSESFMIDGVSATMNRYLSFASMIIPSNDAFIGNEGEMDHALFDGAGNFNSGFEINIFGGDIWDSGTELNDGMGAPFSGIGGMSTSTADPIALHAGLDNFVGTPIGSGENLGQAFRSDTPIARITVEQVPDSTAYIGWFSALALVGFRLVSRKRMGSK